MNLFDEMNEWKPNRNRSRAIGATGVIGFLAGAAMAGQLMMWLGCFSPGKTPSIEILDYWPGFLAGGLIVGFAASITSRAADEW